MTVPADLAEGTATVVSLKVRAADQVTTETYYVILSRPADPSVTDLTIEATPAEYVAGIGALSVTVTRKGPRQDAVVGTINFTQDEDWLSDTTRTFHFPVGGETNTRFILPTEFSSSVIRSGALVATVAPVAGYDTSGAAQVRIISQEGPAVTVTLEHPTYTVAEGAGTLDMALVARAHPSVPSVSADFQVSLTADPQTALSDPESPDYRPVSEDLRFAASDFQMENGALVGRKTISITILDDDVIEGDEYFHLHLGRSPGLSQEIALLDPEGEECSTECPNPYAVTITDNEPAVSVSFGQAAYTVAEGSTQDITVTLSDDPKRTVVIPINVLDEDGASSADYSITPQSVTFNAGETSQTFSFAATADTIDDDGERVTLCFCPTLPPGVSEGLIKEAIITITQRQLGDYAQRPGISVPRCKSTGTFIFWHVGTEFGDQPPPYGWRVERRHRSDEEWITAQFDFLGAESVALQTYSDEYWDWTDTTRRPGVDYTYRVHALDENGQLMEGRNWSRRAPAFCP